jgi:uncharacterized protein (DUF433 family)
MAALTYLEREMYSEAEAARLLRLNQGTLHYWLEGGQRRNKTYEPILRPEPTGQRSVTWGEFVEAGLLRQYRRVHYVPMREMRMMITFLRDCFSTPYPLADHRPFVGDGRHLVQEIQEEAGLAADFCLVAIANGQLVLTSPSYEFVERVEWDNNLAVSWRPHDDPRSPVRMNPDVRFGLPAIGGIRTEIVREHLEDGASPEEVAETFGLSRAEVQWADAFETSRAA